MTTRSIPMARPVIGREEQKEIEAVLRSGHLASGEWVRRFEDSFCRYLGGPRRLAGIATSSGTTALHAALLAMGVRRGDKVVTTPFTFIASVNAILFCGATPVFCDVEPTGMNLDPEKLKTILKRHRTKVVLPVHLFGLPCKIREIVSLARKHGAMVLEDCAQAHGATEAGRKAGTFGDAAAFSFYATKNMMTGEGGMVVTSDRAIEAATRKLINHGRKQHYEHDAIGFNFRMTNLAAALGIAQLRRLDGLNTRRRANAARYNRALRDLPWLTLPQERAGTRHVYHLYTVRLADRDGLLMHLKSNGIDAGIFYPIPVPAQPAYRRLGYSPKDCPEAMRLSREVLSLPVHPLLTRTDLAQIVAAVRSFRPRER